MFDREYTVFCKVPKESTIAHITKGEIPIETGSYNEGILSILDLDVSANIMRNWEWRFDKIFIPIVSTAFGDLFMYSVISGNCFFFQPQYNSLELITNNIDQLLNDALINENIIKNVLYKNKFNQIRKLLGPLNYDETYILKPWLLLGGKDIVENYTSGNLSVYLELVSKHK